VWALALALVGPVTVNERGEPAAWFSWLKLAVGGLLLAVAALEWRARPAPDDEVALPSWSGTLDRITPIKAGSLALLLGAFNPKSLLFIVAGAAVVAQSSSAPGAQTIAWIVFTVVATLGVGLPVAIYVVKGDQAVAILTRLKTWLVRNTSTIIAGLCVIIGVALIGDAVTSLVAG
jgi:threonine/homoserine/homoserine lactone efflux protein